ncbi:MAG: DUF3378 domain-containing protein [Candidatus Diapherotrites archaeon]|uniref:Ribonuclease n=1 Tax=Candidatus Iainarchaeum sp. TaxID=3101447 RepID=A0A8T4L7Z5_9ARCH|nr:DUF3378 domain-containing protein [Candidatus Diapherotrites archaeon]
MPSVLNFKKTEIPAVMAFLRQYDELSADKYQKYRTKVGACSVILFDSGKLLIQGDNANAVSKRILEMVKIPDEQIVGVDETGRGEDFGPFVICGVLGLRSKLREVRDSKKTANIAQKKVLVEKNADQIACIEYSAKTIDELRSAGTNMNQIQAKAVDFLVDFFRRSGFLGKIVIDGNPIAVESKNVFFIPKADDSEPAVAAASIVAKFIRDASKDNDKRASWKKKSA